MSRTAHTHHRHPLIVGLRYDDHATPEERFRFGRAAGVGRIRRIRVAWRPERVYTSGEAVAFAAAVAKSQEKAELRNELSALRGAVNAVARRATDDSWPEEIDDSCMLPRQHRHSGGWDAL